MFSQKLDATRVYLIYSGINSFSLSMAFTVNLVYQATKVGLNPLQLVLVGTMLEATAFLFEVPTGVLADTYSRRLSVIIGVALLGAGLMVEGLFPLFSVVLLAQFIMGIGYTFLSGAADAWIADEIGVEQAGQAYIKAGQVGNVVGLAAIGVSVALASLTISLPIVAGGGLMMAQSLFLMLFMPENGFTPTPADERNTWNSMTSTFSNGTRLVRMRPILLSFILLSLIFGIFSEGFDRLWTPHLLESFTLPHIDGLKPVVWFGLISAVGSLMTLGASEVMRRRLDMNNQKRMSQMLIACYVGMSAAIVGFGLLGNFALALICFWTAGVLRSISGPVETTWMNYHTDSSVRATILSMNVQTNAFGQIFGGPIVGAVGTRFSLRAAITLTGILITPAIWIAARASRQSYPAVQTAENIA